MVAQLYVAILCAKNNRMKSESLASISRRVINSCVTFWASDRDRVTSTLPRVYAEGASDAVFGKFAEDPLLATFFPGSHSRRAPPPSQPPSESAAAAQASEKIGEADITNEAVLAEIVFAARRRDIHEVKRLALLLE